MAVDQCSESSTKGVSPRISFSDDLCLSNTVSIEQHPFRSTSTGSVDFDFCVRKSFEQDYSSADELFFDGKILPTEIKKRASNTAKHAIPSRALDDHDSSISSSFEDGQRKLVDQEKQSTSKSFWGFKRSSSLNCGSGYGRTLCPLTLLSRSYSTGSTSSVKRSTLPKEGHNRANQKQIIKQGFVKHSQAMSSSSGHQKPPLKKNYVSSYANGVHVNHVINVHSGNLFGLGSIFFNGKVTIRDEKLRTVDDKS